MVNKSTDWVPFRAEDGRGALCGGVVVTLQHVRVHLQRDGRIGMAEPGGDDVDGHTGAQGQRRVGVAQPVDVQSRRAQPTAAWTRRTRVGAGRRRPQAITIPGS